MSVLSDLVWLARELGREERGLALLGEGNLSGACGDGSFWVKASGHRMQAIDENGFSRVGLEVVYQFLELDDADDSQVSDCLSKALVQNDLPRPSVETFLHAVCLKLEGVQFVGHTHPTSALTILCSKMGAEPFLRHVFPEPVIVCGPIPVVVSYADPGFALGKATRIAIDQYLDQYQRTPKLILMRNHGLIALGETAQEVLDITLMADKWAKVLNGLYSLGEPEFLSDEHAWRMVTRPDEAIRKKAANK